MYDLIITMKIFSKPKHIIVTALTFFAIFSFLFPVIVNAAEDDVFYPGLGRIGEQLSMRYWAKTFIIGSSVDITLAAICGGENDKENTWGTENGSANCVPPIEQITASLQGENPRMMGGMASMGAMAMDYSVSEPVIPTDMALFMDDTFDDTIFTTPSYAQERTNWSQPTEFFQSATYTLWKTARNISLGLLGVLLGIAGLSILFRSKLSPQVTVTVANILPYLPLSIIGIVLSYPIMAVAYNLVEPLLSMAWAIGQQVVNELSHGAVVTTGGVYSTVGQSFIAVLNPATWTGVAVNGTINFAFGILMLVAGVLVLIGVVRYVFEYAKTIVLFVFYVIAFPILSAVAILPGKQNLFGVLFKKVGANLLAIPVMTLFALIGFGFIASMLPAIQSGQAAAFEGMQYISIGGTVFAGIIRFAIGWGIMWQSFKARQVLEDAFGASGSLMSSFKGASSAPAGKK
jgi:hypothetical protein